MGCEIRWLQDDQVVLIRMFDECTLDDIAEANRIGSGYVAAASQIVHMIADVTAVTSFPVNVFELGKAVKNRDSQNLGWLVVVLKQNGLLHFAASTVARWFAPRNRWAVADSLDEALTIINRQSDNLPDR
jgi:hypothetical protein